MKHFLLTMGLVSFAGLSTANNLEENQGKYLGLGNYVSTQGLSGTFSSYAEISPNFWQLAYFRNDALLRYDAVMEVDENGFFDTMILRTTEGKEEIVGGYGYCLENYCHLSTTIDDNAFEETITFLEDNRIKRVGSLRYYDEDGNEQTMRWTENLVEMNMLFTSSMEELPLEPIVDLPWAPPAEPAEPPFEKPE